MSVFKNNAYAIYYLSSKYNNNLLNNDDTLVPWAFRYLAFTIYKRFVTLNWHRYNNLPITIVRSAFVNKYYLATFSGSHYSCNCLISNIINK